MFFDAKRNAYIDKESGEIIFQEESSTSQNSTEAPSNTATEPISELSPEDKVRFDSLFELASIEHQTNLLIQEEEIRNALEPFEIDVENPHAEGGNSWEDWNVARTMQLMEFEISNEMISGYEGDFNEKEYRASRSCRRQLLTLSFLICVVQVALMIAMIEIAGYAPKSQNPVLGPPVYIMVRFGAKESGLIVHKKEWWRLFSSIMLHAGIWHILPNIAIQLRVGGYLNIIYGTPKWFWIYLVSGVFGEMMSCIFIPDSVGVGSSGALMGMLSSWIVWIIFRWKKIPSECKKQRNCQLFVVVASVVITLATSFTPNVDWAAHAGGAVQGILWGIVLLSNELDHERHQLIGRVIAVAVSIILYIVSLWYMIVKLKPSDAYFSYWDQNDDWSR